MADMKCSVFFIHVQTLKIGAAVLNKIRDNKHNACACHVRILCGTVQSRTNSCQLPTAETDSLSWADEKHPLNLPQPGAAASNFKNAENAVIEAIATTSNGQGILFGSVSIPFCNVSQFATKKTPRWISLQGKGKVPTCQLQATFSVETHPANRPLPTTIVTLPAPTTATVEEPTTPAETQPSVLSPLGPQTDRVNQAPPSGLLRLSRSCSESRAWSALRLRHKSASPQDMDGPDSPRDAQPNNPSSPARKPTLSLGSGAFQPVVSPRTAQGPGPGLPRSSSANCASRASNAVSPRSFRTESATFTHVSATSKSGTTSLLSSTKSLTPALGSRSPPSLSKNSSSASLPPASGQGPIQPLPHSSSARPFKPILSLRDIHVLYGAPPGVHVNFPASVTVETAKPVPTDKPIVTAPASVEDSARRRELNPDCKAAAFWLSCLCPYAPRPSS